VYYSTRIEFPQQLPIQDKVTNTGFWFALAGGIHFFAVALVCHQMVAGSGIRAKMEHLRPHHTGGGRSDLLCATPFV
jgi:hypothetical protein